MVFIDAKMPERRFIRFQWNAIHDEFHFRVRSGNVVIVIVPDKYGKVVLIKAGERGNIGFVADAVAQNFFERQSTLAVSNDAGKAPA